MTDASEIPEWIESFVARIDATVESHPESGPFGFRFRREESEAGESWDIVVYPLPVEFLGGASDGQRASPAYTMDLRSLEALFETIEASRFHSIDLAAQQWNCPSLSLEGTYEGRRIGLRVMAYAPDDVDPGMMVDTTKSE